MRYRLGRYPPQTYTDMWLTMLSMVTGAMCYAVTIGHVSALVQSFDTSRRMYNDKFKQVEEYMVWRKFPRDMRNRITEYYEHRYRNLLIYIFIFLLFKVYDYFFEKFGNYASYLGKVPLCLKLCFFKI